MRTYPFWIFLHNRIQGRRHDLSEVKRKFAFPCPYNSKINLTLTAATCKYQQPMKELLTPDSMIPLSNQRTLLFVFSAFAGTREKRNKKDAREFFIPSQIGNRCVFAKRIMIFQNNKVCIVSYMYQPWHLNLFMHWDWRCLLSIWQISIIKRLCFLS